MAPSRIPRASVVLIAFTWVVTSSAIDFDGQNGITQSELTPITGTVAPRGEAPTTNTETEAKGFDNTVQWFPSSSNNEVPTTAPNVPSSGSGEWSQPTTPMSAESPTVYSVQAGGDQTWSQPTTVPALEGTPPSQSSGLQDHELAQPPTSDTGYQEWAQPSSSDDGNHGREAPTSHQVLLTGSAGVQGSTPPISSDTTARSGRDEPSTSTIATTSSGTGDQDDQGDLGMQTTTTSSLNTESSANMSPNTSASSNTPLLKDSNSTQQSSTTGEHAPFGTVTSKSGECVVGNPNKYVAAADVDWVWEYRIGPNAPKREANWDIIANKNFIMDKIVANKGTLNYCVRWDSTKELSKTVASKFKNMLERQYTAWNHWLIGYNCWPHNDIKINIVGFAVKEASLLDWSDDSFGPITVGDLDVEGDPQCDQTCYRFYDNDAGSWSDTSACKSEPFDISLWPKEGLLGGFGYDWGQEINLEDMMENIDQEQLEILSHEIGHGFGLPDFYKPEDKPNENWPKSIMMAGSSGTVTESDGWMLRRVLEHCKSRFNFG